MQAVSFSPASPSAATVAADAGPVALPQDGQSFNRVLGDQRAADRRQAAAPPAPDADRSNVAPDTIPIPADAAMAGATGTPDGASSAETPPSAPDSPTQQTQAADPVPEVAALLVVAPFLINTATTASAGAPARAALSVGDGGLAASEHVVLLPPAKPHPTGTPDFGQPTDSAGEIRFARSPAPAFLADMPKLAPAPELAPPAAPPAPAPQPPATPLRGENTRPTVALATNPEPVGTQPPPAVPPATDPPTTPRTDRGAPGREGSVPQYGALRTGGLSGDENAARPAAPADGPDVPLARTPPSPTDTAPADPTHGVVARAGSDAEANDSAPPTPVPALPQTTAPLVPAPTAPSGLPPTLATDLNAIIARPPDGPVEITLAPEELGRLRITLSQEGDVLRVIVQAERGETLDLLRRNADVLMQEIRSCGFSGGSFSFSGWGGAQGDPASQTAPPASAAPPRDAPHPAQRPAPAPSAPHAGLDLRL